jgi:hypothetical protein
MGSVGLGNTAALGAFNNRIISQGLDLGRCQINQALGVYVADPNQSFSAGMIVGQSSTGLVQPSAGTAGNILGVAKWNHVTAFYASVVDEQIVLTGVTATNLLNGNLVTPSGGVAVVRVASAVLGGGTVYTVTTDYTVNAANGQITRNGGGAIPSGGTVFVTYSYTVSTSNLFQLYGENFWNNLDEVSQADGRCTVVTDAELLFTAAYDPSQSYAVGAQLYASTTAATLGCFTTNSGGSAVKMGQVFQTPTASDPFLGLRLIKAPGTF